jgi:hypothetical protein
MRSEEEFKIGGSGIDTQYERDYINYRPKIKYTPPVVDSSYGLSADTASQPGLLNQLGESSIISVWEDIVAVIQKIDEVEQTLAMKLKDVSAPISSVFKDVVIEAAEKLGYSGVTNSIPFDLYKKTFEQPDAPESSIIQEAFEEYMSDVDGTINGELYSDVAEIQNDWTDMLDFVKKGLFSQIVPIDKVPVEISTKDVNLENVRAKEQSITDEYAELLKLRKINELIYQELFTKEYGSDRFFQAENELEEVKREMIKLEKRLFTKTEVVDLVRRKASDTDDSIELVKNTIDFDPYAKNKYEVLYGLLKQFRTKEEMQKGLKKMQAILKLSVDGKKDILGATKHNLRGISGGTAKRRINKTLVNGVHLRNEIFSDVYDIMKNLDGVPNVDDFETLAIHMSEGVQRAELMYQSQASDFYKIHTMDSELRTDKLVSVIDKDAARSAYKLMGNVLSYATETTQSWPTEDKISQWLNDFMEHSKIT